MDGTVILLTGGIGSGKSTVRRILEGMGVPCYDADSAVKLFYEVPPERKVTASGLGHLVPDTPESPFLLPEIEKVLGRRFRRSDGGFDSRALAGVIFSDAAKLKAVEDIVFPALAADFDCWRTALPESVPMDVSDTPSVPDGPAKVPHDIVVFESATALDKPDFPKVWDRCIWVDAPEELRIERVMSRDSSSREQVLSRLRLQSPLEEHRGEVDAVILNDCTLPELRPRVIDAMGHILNTCGT